MLGASPFASSFSATSMSLTRAGRWGRL